MAIHNWKLSSISSQLDYGLAKINDKQYLLPLAAEMIVVGRDGLQLRNTMEFGDYRKFSTEETLTFDTQ